MDRAIALDRLRDARVPAGVLYVLETLGAHGHQAVLVGGCVRDTLLARPVKDWDLASSARPEQVQAAFKKTIPTGIEHGTVTVLPPKGPKTPVEVTTFRGDEGYEDGRRPDAVRFLTNLDEDLARRDFTINAMAYDPIGHIFSDPFDGLEDLGRQQIRAVGEARVRFDEDGLRTMRALRFAATLAFELESETAKALGLCVEKLRMVSRERVRVELAKMLAAKSVKSSLNWMWVSGIWEIVLGTLSRPSDRAQLLKRLDRIDALSGEPWLLRLAALLEPHAPGDPAAAAVLDDLRLSRQERRTVLVLLGQHARALQSPDMDEIAMRRAHVALTPEFSQLARNLAGWDAAMQARFAEAIADAPATMAELAVGAKELIGEGILRPGPKLGDCLRALMDWVLMDPSRNQKEALLQKAKALCADGL